MDIEFNQTRDWVIRVIANVRKNKKIKALYFGLYEAETGYMMYSTGSKKYHRSNEDWPCIVDWTPNISPLAFTNVSCFYKDWEDFFSRLFQQLTGLFRSQEGALPPSIEYAAIGFDEGSLLAVFDRSIKANF